MSKLHRLLLEEECFIINCSLYGHNLTIQSPANKYLGTGGVHYRNFLQLVFTTHALQNEFEPREFKFLWSKVNGKSYRPLIEASILTWWECFSTSFNKYLKRSAEFKLFCRVVFNQCKTDSNKNKIASDYLLLASQEQLITIAHFLSAYCDVY